MRLRNLAIVPARGGSKRLHKKNIKLLDNKPLVQHTLEAVVNSGVFDTVILSSDDEDILKVADAVEGVTPELRSAELAKDTTKVLELIVKIANREGYAEKYDTIAYFLPTCPFRLAKHIKEGYELLDETVDGVVSITNMEDPIQLSLGRDETTKIINPEAILAPSPLVTGQTRSQDFVTYYRPNGGFYAAWVKSARKNENFFKGNVRGYYMDRIHSVDIDTDLDFKWAQFLIDNGFFSFQEA